MVRAAVRSAMGRSKSRRRMTKPAWQIWSLVTAGKPVASQCSSQVTR